MGGGFGDWIIGVYLRFSTDGPVTMARLSAASQAANAQLLRQQGLIDANTAAMLRYQRQIEMVRLQQIRLGTVMAGGIALGGIALSVAGIDQAAQLQKAMVAVGIATNTPDRQMQKFYEMAMGVSDVTAQSMATIGNEMATAASSGLKLQSQLLSAFPLIARAADVMWLSPKHVDPVDAVQQLTQLTHLFGAYQGPLFTHMLNRATQLMFAQPEGIQRMLMQGKYFIPMAMQAGVPEDDVFRVMMSMGQTGLGRGRGGTGVRSLIEYLLGAATETGHLSMAQHLAMGAGVAGRPGLNLLGPDGRLRGEFEDKHGNLLLGKVLAFLERERTHFRPADFANDLTNAFLQQGGLVAGTLLLPQVYAQTQRNWQVLEHQDDIEGMWKRYRNTTAFAWPAFVTNFQNVLAAIFLPTLPTVTKDLQGMAQWLGSINQNLMHNQDEAKEWADAIVGVTGWAAARWGIGVLQISKATLGFMGSMNTLSGAVDKATGAILVDAGLLNGVGRRPRGPGGVTPIVLGGKGAPAAEEEVGSDVITRGWAWLTRTIDVVLLGGIGSSIVRTADRWTTAFGLRFVVPMMNFVSKLRVVQALGGWTDTAASAVGRLGLGLLRIVGPIGEIVALASSFVGPDTPWAVWGDIERRRADIRRRAVHGGDLQGARFRGLSAPPAIHIHGNIEFNLPRGTPQAIGRAAFIHFMNLTGSISTSAYLPTPVTVGGAAFGGSR